jgi:hypothetical protein
VYNSHSSNGRVLVESHEGPWSLWVGPATDVAARLNWELVNTRSLILVALLFLYAAKSPLQILGL